MNSSLDKLASNLSDFKHLSKEFSDEKLKLVKKKGVCPYEYMNSFKRFKEDFSPDIDCFLVHRKTLELLKKYIKDLKMFGNYLK